MALIPFEGDGGGTGTTGANLLAQNLGGNGAVPSSPSPLANVLSGAAQSVTPQGAGVRLPAWFTTNFPDYHVDNPGYGSVSGKGTRYTNIVYMGSTIKKTDGLFDFPMSAFGLGDDIKVGDGLPGIHEKAHVSSVDQALALPGTWSQKHVESMMTTMQKMGFPIESYDDMASLWKKGVLRAADAFNASQGKVKITPMDAIEMYAKDDAGANALAAEKDAEKKAKAAAAYAKAHYTGTQTAVTKSVSDISQGDAWAQLHSTLSNLLGRDPNDQEVRDFAHRMNVLAAQNPTISRSSATYKDGQKVGATTDTSSGGFDANDLAQAANEQAQADPDYGAYQASTTYFNAAMSALGAIGSVG